MPEAIVTRRDGRREVMNLLLLSGDRILRSAGASIDRLGCIVTNNEAPTLEVHQLPRFENP